jgi:hypothetical protein
MAITRSDKIWKQTAKGHENLPRRQESEPDTVWGLGIEIEIEIVHNEPAKWTGGHLSGHST